MPANRNALLRYRTIDRCLRNTGRRWTLDDLIDAVSAALYEYEGRRVDVSRRTVQLDLQAMRSDRLGYAAPIEVYERKYYRYAERGYAITDNPLTEQDLSRLREVVDTLRHFTGFRQMDTFAGVVSRLRDQLGAGRTDGRRIIDFEHNAQLRGLHWIDPLYEITAAGYVVEVDYQSFRTRLPKTYTIEPHFLKESRNRFFLLGYPVGAERVMILALDRILGLRDTGLPFARRRGLEPETFFRHTIGVSVTDTPRLEVVVRLSPHRAPYVLTKPLHPSQRVTARGDRYVEITLDVQHSFELESELLALGDDAQVVAPIALRRRMQAITQASARAYDQPLTDEDFARVGGRFRKTGFVHLPHFLLSHDSRRLSRALRQLQQNPKLFPDPPAPGQVEITRLLPEKVCTSLLAAANDWRERLGIARKTVELVLLHRFYTSEPPVLAKAADARLFVCLTRWHEGRQGPEFRLGEQPTSLDASYGEALVVRPDMPLRVRSQRKQVFWILELA